MVLSHTMEPHTPKEASYKDDFINFHRMDSHEIEVHVDVACPIMLTKQQTHSVKSHNRDMC